MVSDMQQLQNFCIRGIWAQQLGGSSVEFVLRLCLYFLFQFCVSLHTFKGENADAYELTQQTLWDWHVSGAAADAGLTARP